MIRPYTISVFSENSPGVLHRLTTIFTRRKINIESLTVCETEREGISRFTIVVCVKQDLIDTLVKQIARIIEVVDVFSSMDNDLVYKSVALLRVATKAEGHRGEVDDIAARYNGKIVYATDDSAVLEVSGSEDEIRTVYELLEKFGILEFAQSGRVALRKGSIW